MNRAAAINFARAGAKKLWAGTVDIHPGAKTGAHHHGALESVIYVISGKARMRWGEHLEFTAEAGPGDFIYVPPWVPHQVFSTPHLHVASEYGSFRKAFSIQSYVTYFNYFSLYIRDIQEINANDDKTLSCVLVRSDNEAVVVNLPHIEPVEKPEGVLWIDPTHRAAPVSEEPTAAPTKDV